MVGYLYLSDGDTWEILSVYQQQGNTYEEMHGIVTVNLWSVYCELYFKAPPGNSGSSFVTNLPWMTQPDSKSGSFSLYEVFQQSIEGEIMRP
jgi:hypothetical protein